jgi:hypothetical protein
MRTASATSALDSIAGAWKEQQGYGLHFYARFRIIGLMKEIIWQGSSYDDLKAFPGACDVRLDINWTGCNVETSPMIGNP